WVWELIPEDEVASDLVGHWNSGRVGQVSGFGPGIFVKDPDRFDEQLEAARQSQEDWFNFLYEQGEDADKLGQRSNIT
ncbi:MAG: hypothetical protein GWO24_27955, partial [Akkermansiaceae bacterium]|nr:hypothetical protein [Akkermansiaceae bacterium]